MYGSTVDQWLVDWQSLPTTKNSYANGGPVKGPSGVDKVTVPSAEPGGDSVNYSEGEYIIPVDVVQALGRGTFDKILEAFHSPVNGDTA